MEAQDKPVEAPAPEAKPTTPFQVMVGWVHQVMLCTVNGAMGCLAGFQREAVLYAACGMMGKIVGDLYQGYTETNVQDFRNRCARAFRDEMNRVQIVVVPRPPTAGDKSPEPVEPNQPPADLSAAAPAPPGHSEDGP